MADLRTTEVDLMNEIAAMEPSIIEAHRRELLEKNKATPADDWSEEDLQRLVLLTSTLRSKSRAGAPKSKEPKAAKAPSKSKPVGDLLDSI